MRTQPPPKAKKPTPKSGKQRSKELRARRKEKLERPAAPRFDPRTIREGAGTSPCNPSLLAPNNSYGVDFTLRGYYVDEPFTCVGCGREEVWKATQQKWWYEVAKGEINTKAIRCRACRRVERARVDEVRRLHFEGLAKKGKKPPVSSRAK